MAEHSPDSDLATLTDLGKRMKIEGRDLEKFIHTCMKRLGYADRQTYYTKEEKRTGGYFGGNDNSEDGDL